MTPKVKSCLTILVGMLISLFNLISVTVRWIGTFRVAQLPADDDEFLCPRSYLTGEQSHVGAEQSRWMHGAVELSGWLMIQIYVLVIYEYL